MAIDTLLQLFAKIFIMVAVGYFLRRRNIITVQIKQALNFMIVNVFMPFSILVSGNSAFSKEMSHSLLLVAGLSLIYYIASMAIGMGLGKLFHMEEHRARIFVLMQSFANVGFLGIPLAEELFGATGTLVAVVYNLAFDVIFFTYGMYYIRHGGKLDLKALLGNVVAISAIGNPVLLAGADAGTGGGIHADDGKLYHTFVYDRGGLQPGRGKAFGCAEEPGRISGICFASGDLSGAFLGSGCGTASGAGGDGGRYSADGAASRNHERDRGRGTRLCT